MIPQLVGPSVYCDEQLQKNFICFQYTELNNNGHYCFLLNFSYGMKYFVFILFSFQSFVIQSHIVSMNNGKCIVSGHSATLSEAPNSIVITDTADVHEKSVMFRSTNKKQLIQELRNNTTDYETCSSFIQYFRNFVTFKCIIIMVCLMFMASLLIRTPQKVEKI